jgi:hypothetical protein
MHEIRVSYPVPYVCQFASPELVRAFVNEEQPLESDPRWKEYGAESAAEYAHWARRACGVVCVKMAVEALTGCPPQAIMEWVTAGLALDGYLTELRSDRPDRPIEKGWRHASLVRLAVERGCHAEMAAPLSLQELVQHIRADRLVIASVTSELGEEGPITRKSGHLVVVYGFEAREEMNIAAVILHNPSGRSAAMQQSVRIPVARFLSGFSGRGIVIGAGSKETSP